MRLLLKVQCSVRLLLEVWKSVRLLLEVQCLVRLLLKPCFSVMLSLEVQGKHRMSRAAFRVKSVGEKEEQHILDLEFLSPQPCT